MLEVANLEVVYLSVVRVVEGISLAVPEGEVVALLGPNGSGKTSTLRAIAGLLDLHDGKATKGSVRLFGEDLLCLRPEQVVARGVGQVLEGRRVFADLTVEENLIAGGYSSSRRSVARELERAYHRFPVLRERRRQRAGYLSGGEQQLLAIGRALMSRPKLLLLDEPSLGLAPKLVSMVARLVADIHAEGVSILLVEQNASMALELADHAYLMENGRIVLDGPADDLKEDRDVQEFYLGQHADGAGRRSFRDVKHYRRRKRWLS